MKSVYLATAYSFNSKGKWFKRIAKYCDKFPLNLLYRLLLGNRFKRITKVTAKIMADKFIVFSPITHSHPVACIGGLPNLSHEFWLAQDKFWVDACDEVWVYDGLPWRNSYGVMREIEWALADDKPVWLVNKFGKRTWPIMEI